MTHFRLFTAVGLGGLALGLGGCLKAPNYPTTPEITFDSIRIKHDVSTSQPIDSVFITIRFQDGDGDLGLSSTESATAPYAYPSRFNNNFFVEPYLVSNGVPTSLVSLGRTVTGAYNSRFEHIATSSDNHSAPIKGVLTRVYAIAYRTLYLPGETAQFTVSIADRALHESNVVTTSTITFPK